MSFICDSILQFLDAEIATTDGISGSEELDNLFSQLPDPPVDKATPLMPRDDEVTKRPKEFQPTSEEELQRLLAKNDNTNTKRSTATWVRRFKKWAARTAD